MSPPSSARTTRTRAFASPISALTFFQIATLFDALTADVAPSTNGASTHEYGTAAASASSPAYAPQTSQPVPLRDVKPIKTEPSRVKDEKPRVHSASTPAMREETDEEMAARLQAEFNAASTGRASRASASGAAAGAKKKKPAVKRKSAAVVGSDGEEVEKKKRKGGGGGAFNKEMILRWVIYILSRQSRRA